MPYFGIHDHDNRDGKLANENSRNTVSLKKYLENRKCKRNKENHGQHFMHLLFDTSLDFECSMENRK